MTRPVYIVEDEPELRDALALSLSVAGLQTEEFASAEHFWESAPHGEPYCVVLDNRLPGMSGLDLLPRLIERSPRAAVIVVTGHGDVPTAVRAMKLGAFHFVEKPFDAEALVAVVLEAAQRAGPQAADAVRFEQGRAALTEREAQTYELLLEGCPSKTIAARLDITVRTAEHHRGAVFKKFGVNSVASLMRLALARNA